MINSATLLRRLTAGAAATVFTVLMTAAPVTAQMQHGKMMPKMSHGKMMHPKMMASKTVYICKTCKEYYTPTQAKTMKFMDPMGHKLTKMAKAPAGFAAGGKMMGHGKM